MTYAELLAKIDSLNDSCSVVEQLTTTLRAVVELHEPIEGHEHLCSACWFGDGMMSYPCPTIQAIEKELG
jgi:hypothetical protein